MKAICKLQSKNCLRLKYETSQSGNKSAKTLACVQRVLIFFHPHKMQPNISSKEACHRNISIFI